MRLFDLRLRFWAYRQFMYELEYDPRDSESSSDFAAARRQLLWRRIVGGHLDDGCIAGMETDFPQLGDPDIIGNDEAVVRVVCSHFERYIAIGEKRSGVLKGYLLAQRDHLLSCKRCRRFVCAAVRKDAATGRQVLAVFNGLSPADKRELAEKFAPARVRRRGDTSLN